LKKRQTDDNNIQMDFAKRGELQYISMPLKHSL